MPVTFDDSLPVIHEWVDKCKSQHEICSADPKPFPSRLLFIDSVDSIDRVKLVQPVMQHGFYATLSHCWGSPSGILCTTKNTLAAHLECIELSKLAQNFRDAIEVTKKLGLQYLWIDSLCIIQDDELDWQQESSKMASVYQNSFITIAATAAADSTGGCLFTRQPAGLIPFYRKDRAGNETLIPGAGTYVRTLALESKSLLESPLYRRGWVLQEMVLSNRVLHFAKDQLFWRCRSRITSEDGVFDAPQGSTYFDLNSPAEAHKSWWTWVEDFSGRALTKQSDKFAALAGLTKLVEDTRGYKPIAGLWDVDLHFGLLWYAQDQATRSPIDYIPTWSWLSINGCARSVSRRGSEKWEEHRYGVKEEAEIESTQLDWSGEPLTSSIKKGVINMKARIQKAAIATDPQQIFGGHEYDKSSGHYAQFQNFATFYRLIPFDNQSTTCEGICCFDLKPPNQGSIVHCLQVSVNKREGLSSYHDGWSTHDVLLVEPTGRSGNEFRRIGLGIIKAFEDETDYFHNVSKVSVQLV